MGDAIYRLKRFGCKSVKDIDLFRSNSGRMAALSAFEVNQILATTPIPVSWEDVATTFSIGGLHTDLQRQMKTEKLIGQVVQWRLRVYGISLEGDRYRVISEPVEIHATDAINLLRVIALIQANDAQSVDTLEKAQTGTLLIVRGLVKEITLRSAVVLAPAFAEKAAPGTEGRTLSARNWQFA